VAELTKLLEHPLAPKLGLMLVHSLWQGVVVACLGLLATVVLRRTRPAIRYLVFSALLLMMAACPVATFLAIPDENPMAAVLAHLVATPASALREALPSTPVRHPATVGRIAESSGNSTARGRPAALWEQLRPALPWVAAGWFVGVVLLSLRLLLRWSLLLRIGRRAGAIADHHWEAVTARLSRSMKVRRAVRLLRSAGVAAPIVMGWLRPVILLPPSVLTGLTPTQLEAVLAHELAHIRRHDYLANLLQTVVETLLFYHPAVWWLSRLIRQEREHCCDDLAVAACGDARAYALALAELEQLRQTPAVAVGASSGSLLTRVWRLVGGAGPHRGRPYGWSIAGAAVVALTGALLALHMTATPVLAAEARIIYAETATEPSERDVARRPLAKAKVIKLTVRGRLAAQGVGSDTEVRRLIAGVLQAAGFQVVSKGRGDAEMVTTVTPTAYADLPHSEQVKARSLGSLVSMDVLGHSELRIGGRSVMDTGWEELRGLRPPQTPAPPAWRVAKECARRSVLTILERLAPDRHEVLLRSRDPAIREAAFATLTVHRDLEARLVRRVAGTALDRKEDPAVRVAATIALFRAASAKSEARAALHSVLLDGREEPFLRAMAIIGYTMLGPEKGPAVEEMLDLLDDRSAVVRWMAASGVAAIVGDEDRDRSLAERATPALVRALDDPDQKVRQGALDALESIGPSPAALPRLMALARGDDPELRTGAVEAIRAMGPAGVSALPTLTHLLRDPVAEVRESAAYALYGMRSASLPALPALLGAMHERTGSQTTFDTFAQQAFGEMGPKAVPALTRALKDSSPRLREAAASGLGSIGPAAAPAVPTLAGLLRDPEERVRFAAASSLGRMGPSARVAVPALMAAAADSRSALRNTALGALVSCAPDDQRAIGLALRVLRTEGTDSRWAALTALASSHPEARQATEALAETLRRDQNAGCRQSAAGILGRRPGVPPDSAVAALAAALADRDRRVQSVAVWALGNIGPAAAPAVPALRKLRGGDPSQFATGVHAALVKIQGREL
jgi:beta-lactamase regulating signal transducer with metallopeptidase domain/HEAT repeat protein